MTIHKFVITMAIDEGEVPHQGQVPGEPTRRTAMLSDEAIKAAEALPEGARDALRECAGPWFVWWHLTRLRWPITVTATRPMDAHHSHGFRFAPVDPLQIVAVAAEDREPGVDFSDSEVVSVLDDYMIGVSRDTDAHTAALQLLAEVWR